MRQTRRAPGRDAGLPSAQILDITGPLEVFARTARWLRDHRDLQRNAYEIELVAPRRLGGDLGGLRLLRTGAIPTCAEPTLS